MNNAHKNAKAIRSYVEYLRDAKRRSEKTIEMIERSIRLFELATKEADFASFDRHKAKNFVVWLDEQGKSPKRSYHILRHVKAFFEWLAFRQGYKSKIDVTDLEYLALSKENMQAVSATTPVEWPDINYVLSLVRSITDQRDVDFRDAALICFLFLSGMRDMAVASLPLGCFNSETLEVHQIPGMGVKTKFSKLIVSQLFVFDEEILGYVLRWVDKLKTEFEFSIEDPMFPRTRIIRDRQTAEFSSDGLEPVFWQSAEPIRKILKYRAAEAGLRYYKPHAFRHAAAQLALRQCSTPEEIRAVSQCLGHEYVATTLTSYGKLDGHRVRQVVESIDFQASKRKKLDPQLIRQLQEFIIHQQKDVDS